MSSSISNESPEQRKHKARRTLLTIVGVCIAPFIAAVIAFNFFPPSGRVNYGELLEPVPLTSVPLFESLKGKWLLVQIDSGECDRACEAKLYNMRQSRTAQGREMDRIERVWIRQDEKLPSQKLAPLYEGTHVLQGAPQELLSRFPATKDVRDHIYVVDPLGNLMLRYPPDADPKGMIKDLGRLLKVSRVG